VQRGAIFNVMPIPRRPVSPLRFEVKLLLINFVLVLWLLIYQKYPSMGEENGPKPRRCLQIAIVV
jgi:hypothetical protein